MKTLLFAAALLVPGLAYGQNPSASLSVQVVPGSSPPNGIPCALGPNYTGVIPTDAQTAGFTTCVSNSDFSTPLFANLNNWLAGLNNCGTATTPIWWNTDPGAAPGKPGGAAPCSDIAIITDPLSGSQVLDLQFNATDYAAGRGATDLESINPSGGTLQGWPLPTGIYVEWRGRLTTATIHVYDGDTSGSNHLTWAPFKYQTRFQSGNFIEWDFDEFGSHPLAAGGCLHGAGIGGLPGDCDDNICAIPCSNFDPTIMHTYGILYTTDGNKALSVCYYLDRTPGTFIKDQCQNSTNVRPATTAFTSPSNTAQRLLLELGPAGSLPTAFNGRQDIYLQYWRVFSCPTWNQTNAVCSGPVMNH